MKTGLFGQQLTLLEELKAVTYRAHVRLQDLPFFEALVACQLRLESYVGQLRALSVIHGVLEQALDGSPNPAIASVWQNGMRKLPLLQQDLRYFEPRVVADLKEAVEEALKTAELIRLRSLQQPASLLGYLYVLEGSTLGALVLRPQFARAFVLEGNEGLAYLHNYGPAVHAQWAQYQQRMNALRLSAEEREQILQAAGECFEKLQAIFQTLHPFQAESLTYLVTSINPEAGRHPVPADAREVTASLRAADLCWQRFPYYEFRYGERGRRFAKSDGAWLATLCQFDLPQIIQQVKWLGRVLSTRGMPTLMLQVQLEILVEELVAVVPEKRLEYEKLLPAAAELHAARRRYFADETFRTLADEFERAVGPEWSERYRNAGPLLVAAVADELAGSAGTVENLRQWMTDPARFPAAWISAVEATLAQAQAGANQE